MGSVFALGLVVGLQHAMEADHVAAVAAITRNTASRRKALVQGCAWGLGHSIALLALVLLVYVSGLSISDTQAHWLEFGVGLMLIVLGLRAIQTARRERLHVHLHRHEDGQVHIHAHRHTEEAPEDHDHHSHGLQVSGKALLPLLVGLVHGIAGSAALIVLLAALSLSSLAQAVGYVLVFGAGSIAGMAALSLAFSLPAGWVQKQAAWGSYALSAAVGTAALAIGLHRCFSSMPV